MTSDEAKALILSMRVLGINPAEHVATIRHDVQQIREKRMPFDMKAVAGMEATADAIARELEQETV